MMNAIDACYQMYKDIEKMITEKTKNIRYDRTFRAKITSQISADKYKILYKNKEYPASCDIKTKIGDMVWVCAPENNWNRLYIQSSKSDDDTITQVNGVKGSAETSYKSGYVNISPEDIGLGKVPNVVTNDQTPTFTQASALTNITSGEKFSLMLGKIAKGIADFITHKADSVIHITSNDRSLWNTVSNKVESESGKGLSTNDYTDTEQNTLADVNDKKHTHTNKTILDGITQALIDRWNAAETNVQSDWNVTDTASDAFIKNKPSSLPANGGTASLLSNAVQIPDYNTFVPSKVAQGAMTPVKANADANSPWNNTTSGFLIQSNSADSWHLLIFRSGGDGWAYRSYYQNVWNNWRIWSTFDGKYSSLTEKPTSFPPSTHTHTKSQITDMPTNISLDGIIKGSGSFDGSSNLTISTLPTHKDYLAFPINQPNGYVKLFTIEVKEIYANIPIIFNIRGRNSGTVGHDMATIFLDLANSNSKNPPIAHFKYLYDSRYGENILAYMNNGGEATLIEIWCKNAESYDSILLTNLSASDPKFKITYGGEISTDEPVLEGYTKYTPTMGTISADITGNAATVNGKTVNTNVPSDAKFTDTVYTHPNSGATAGTYKSVTINAQGHVTAGSNPTTLAGYGITDAAASNHTHTKSQITDFPDTFVMGTQTATTGAWTGILNLPAIYHGLTINYWLPYTGNGNATLNLTLSDGSSTGAKNCYFRGSTALTTHYPAGSAISLTYLEGVSISGSGTYTGWWASADYDSNDYYRLRYQQAIKCGTTAIVAANIIVGNDIGYQHLKLGAVFDIRYPILYANTAISAGSTGTDNYVFYPFTITTTQALTLTAYKPVYIKGNLSGTVFTPVSTASLTQSEPTSEDGCQYLLLGTAYSTTAMYLLIEHPIYEYKEGVFQEYSNTKRDIVITALVSGWSSTAPYSQTISVSGIKSTDTPSLFPYTPKTLSPTQIKLSRRMFSYVTDAETGNGTITLYCGENKPSSDFDILAIGISK